MVNGKTVLIQKNAVKQLKKEALRLKVEFKEYLEDLELFTKQEFWEAIERVESNNLKKFETIDEMLKELENS